MKNKIDKNIKAIIKLLEWNTPRSGLEKATFYSTLVVLLDEIEKEAEQFSPQISEIKDILFSYAFGEEIDLDEDGMPKVNIPTSDQIVEELNRLSAFVDRCPEIF